MTVSGHYVAARLIYNAAWNKNRGVLEFDLSELQGGAVVTAALKLSDSGGTWIQDPDHTDSPPPPSQIRVLAYDADLESTSADYDRAASLVTTFTTQPGQGPDVDTPVYSLNLTDLIKSYLARGQTRLGLRFEAGTADTFESFGGGSGPRGCYLEVERDDVNFAAGGLAWNEARGPDAQAPLRGFDYQYTVTGNQANKPVVAFYWADAAGQPIEQIPAGKLAPSLLRVADVPNGKQYVYNEPARWEAPPAGAGSILMRLDPATNGRSQGSVGETDETDNEAEPLALHTADEILAGAVVPELSGPYNIVARFRPGAGIGESITLSEAEVALGVDHFNWVQTWHGPGNWQPEVWQDAVDAAGHLIVTFSPATGQLTYASGPLQGQPVVGGGVPVDREVTDPIVQSIPGHTLTLVQRVDGNKTDDVSFLPFSISSDGAPFYLDFDEWSRFSTQGPGGTASATEFQLRDAPQVPVQMPSVFDADVMVHPFEGPNYYMTFHTRLVGVDAANRPVELPGNRTGFQWRSNTVSVGDQPSGGGLEVLKLTAPANAPRSGGVFGVQYDDGTPVPGFPTAPPAISIPGVTPGATPQLMLVADPAGGTAQLYSPAGGAYQPGAAVTFFPGVTGPVRVATADVNGDGVPDYIGATGPGVANQLAVIDGKTGAALAAFPPFEPTFTGGLFVVAADLDGDGMADLIVAPDEGGGPVLVVYSGARLAAGQSGDAAQLARFFGIDDPAFRGGARPALGDINGDGAVDLVVSAGFMGGPRVALFDGRSVIGGPPVKLLPDFFAFEPGLRNGAFVTAGDLDGDGKADLAFGGGPGGAPRVRVFNGAKALAAGPFADADAIADTAQVANFFAGDTASRGGVRLTMRDADGDGTADLIAGSGEGEPAAVRVYKSATLLGSANPSPDQTLDPFGGATLANGVFVG
jgi:hypothetical protein